MPKPTVDHDAERLVVSFLLDPGDSRDGAESLASQLHEDDFSNVGMRTVWRGIQHCWSEGIDLTTAAVHEALHGLGFPKPDHGDLLRITLEAPSSLTQAKASFRWIRELRRWRELLELGDMFRNALDRGGIPVRSVIEQGQKLLDEMQESEGGDVRVMRDVVRGRVMEMKANEGKPVRRMLTGFEPLDNLVGGLGESDLVVLAAATGGGKSAFAGHVFESVAESGRDVLVASAEMHGWELGDRLLSRASRVPMVALRDNHLDPDQWRALDAAANEDHLGRIHVLERHGSLTVQRIKSIAKAMHRRVGLSLVVVDYLQLISSIASPGERGRTRQVEVAAVARGLKNLALDLRVPVLALSQFNREGVRDGGEPELWHLRESGEIEQASNMVLFLWDPSKGEGNERSLLCKKHRSGATNRSAKLRWDGKTVSFRQAYS